jgi:predicted PhzF superfamily epimerase YddE/YHI9
MYKYGIVNENQAENIIFEQGYSMNRPSEIMASLEVSDGKIIKVRVGGVAEGLKQIEIEI